MQWMVHGGICFLVTIYIIIQAAACAVTLRLIYGIDWAHLLLSFMAFAIVVAQYFEPPSLVGKSRKVVNHFYDYLRGNKLLLVSNDESSPCIYNIPNNDHQNGWHPLETLHCAKCPVNDKVRPPRARHCEDCGVCRLAFDHHCIFVNACISEANYPAFYCFLIWSFLGLAASKVFDLQVSLVSLITLAAPTSEYDVQFLQWFATGMSESGLATLTDLTMLPSILLALNCFFGLIVAGFILVLLVTQTINLLCNTTSTEYQKYNRLNLSFPYNYVTSQNGWGFLKNLYWNVRDRVWRGPLLDRQLNRNEFLYALHVLACFVVPSYWNLSGEGKSHASPKMIAKYGVLPNDVAWTLQSKPTILESIKDK